MHYLTLAEVVALHERLIGVWGGRPGLRDLAGLDSAVSQPRQTFAGGELYPSMASKASALCFFLIQNHPFLDGNKRVGHAAMETFLIMNGQEIDASVDETETMILDVASGRVARPTFETWIEKRLGLL